MSEGGLLPWKVQPIQHSRGPTANFRNLANPLPHPPDGTMWIRNDTTREWSLVRNTVVGGDGGTADEIEKDDVRKDTTVVEDSPKVVYSGTPIISGDQDDAFDYVLHKVQPTDTFQGICLKYMVSPQKLRQINKFSGSNLHLGPRTLTIPLQRKSLPVAEAVMSKEQSKKSKINKFILAFQGANNMGQKEANAYLIMNDWDLEKSIDVAKLDYKWENTMMDERMKVLNKPVRYPSW